MAVPGAGWVRWGWVGGVRWAPRPSCAPATLPPCHPAALHPPHLRRRQHGILHVCVALGRGQGVHQAGQQALVLANVLRVSRGGRGERWGGGREGRRRVKRKRAGQGWCRRRGTRQARSSRAAPPFIPSPPPSLRSHPTHLLIQILLQPLHVPHQRRDEAAGQGCIEAGARRGARGAARRGAASPVRRCAVLSAVAAAVTAQRVVSDTRTPAPYPPTPALEQHFHLVHAGQLRAARQQRLRRSRHSRDAAGAAG